MKKKSLFLRVFGTLSLIASSSLYAVDIVDIYSYQEEKVKIQKLFSMNGLDYKTKSAIGWVRVLNNPEKRKEYKLDNLASSEIIYLTSVLKELSKLDAIAFEGKLR